MKDKFALIMEDFYNGNEEGFERWVNRQIKLCWFRPYLVVSYFITAIRNSTDNKITYGFPNLKSWSNIAWTLRWMWIQIIEGDEIGRDYHSRKSK